MFYRVTAKLKQHTATEFLQKLLDGSISQQQPDGQEIVNAMEHAVVTDAGNVEFSIVCYCSTPLAHERATVFDNYFDDLTTEVIPEYKKLEGRSFMNYLAEVSELHPI